MRLPVLFRRERSEAARRERQEELDRLLTEGLRTLSGLLARLADHVEQQRLARRGYAEQERFLAREEKK